MYKCDACDKHYSSSYNLKQHFNRQPLCQKWIELNPGLKDYIDDKFQLPISDINKTEHTKCFICNTTFANIGNLNRHLDTSLICSKWSMYRNLQPLTVYIKGSVSYGKNRVEREEGYVNNIWQLPFIKHDESHIMHEEFIAPKYSMCHIIWNIFLIDKDFVSKFDMKEVFNENNVKYVIAILPTESNFKSILNIDIDHALMQYEGHDMQIDKNAFDEQCKKIEEVRNMKTDVRSNIVVFCNNGFQRSIPFLCYYLLKYHPNEAPNVEKAIDLILPQVDKIAYLSNRNEYIEKMKLLFFNLHLSSI